MKRLQMIFALLLGVVLASGTPAVAAGKIGFVNMQRAVTECAEGKAAAAEFQKDVDKIRVEMESEQKVILDLKDEIERKAVVMNEDEKRKLVREFEDKQIDFRRKVEETQVDLQARQQKLFNDIGLKVKQEVLKLGASGEYDAILDAGVAIYADPGSDVTDQVIKAYDASNG